MRDVAHEDHFVRCPSGFKGTIEVGFRPRCGGIKRKEAVTGFIHEVSLWFTQGAYFEVSQVILIRS